MSQSEILPQIAKVFYDGDLNEFVRLLRIHPEFLRNDDGTDLWMSKAALNGMLPFVEALVDLGMNVNESCDRYDPAKPDAPFYQAEGPILQAAAQGHLDVVRWLLEHGAKINYVVQGMPRCFPLVDASTYGHLDVAKLLVEYGADIHATWRGINAVTQAEDYGQWEIRDFLRSLGARSLRETTPPNYSQAHELVIKHLTTKHGPLGEWRLEIYHDPLVTLHLIPANDKCDAQTLFTVGVSDHRLPQGPDEYACSELRSLLPSDWPLTDVGLVDPNLNWPIEWIKRIVCQLASADQWPEEPVIFMNGNPPTPLSLQTELCGWLCLKSEGESVHAPDYRWIDIHSLFPIYLEEAALVRQSGSEELVNRFQARGIPLNIDPQRPNVALEFQ